MKSQTRRINPRAQKWQVKNLAMNLQMNMKGMLDKYKTVMSSSSFNKMPTR